MSKKEKIKHYFALDIELNKKFMEHLNVNCMDKQKLIEKLIIEYLQDIKNNEVK